MKASELKEALKICIDLRRACLIWSPPGLGKSQITFQLARELEMDLRDVRAAYYDPTDLKGVPDISGEVTIWKTPAFWPQAGRGILFLDEILQAPPSVQAACLQLTLDRRLGDYILPPEWAIIGATNRMEDRAGTNRMITPLLNRFIHLDLDVDSDASGDWHRWAIETEIAPEVRAFLRYRPAALFDFDPKSGERAFATPRTWEFVSEIWKRVSAATNKNAVALPLLAGTVGPGRAAEFLAYTEYYAQLPDPLQVLQSPKTAPVPKEPAILYALVGALTEAVRKSRRSELLDGLGVYAGRLVDEFAVLLIKDAAQVQPKVINTPSVGKWRDAHSDVLLDAKI
jgi:hypothetical protein